MYIVRTRDKQHDIDSEALYNEYREAIEHLRRFKNNSSNLYSNMSIIDAEKDLVLIIILFDKTGKIIAEFHDGSIVKLKPEFQREQDEANTYYWITKIQDEKECCQANPVDVEQRYVFDKKRVFNLEWLDLIQL